MALTICPDCTKEISASAPFCPGCGAPIAAAHSASGNVNTLGGCLGVLAIVVAVIFVVNTFSRSESSDAPVHHYSAPDPRPSAPDNNIVKSIDAKTLKNWRHFILRRGGQCPAIVYIRDRGIAPQGQRYEILCGPSALSGDAYPTLHYALYPETGTLNICEKFDVLSAECM